MNDQNKEYNPRSENILNAYLNSIGLKIRFPYVDTDNPSGKSKKHVQPNDLVRTNVSRTGVVSIAHVIDEIPESYRGVTQHPTHSLYNPQTVGRSLFNRHNIAILKELNSIYRMYGFHTQRDCKYITTFAISPWRIRFYNDLDGIYISDLDWDDIRINGHDYKFECATLKELIEMLFPETVNMSTHWLRVRYLSYVMHKGENPDIAYGSLHTIHCVIRGKYDTLLYPLSISGSTIPTILQNGIGISWYSNLKETDKHWLFKETGITREMLLRSTSTIPLNVGEKSIGHYVIDNIERVRNMKHQE